MVGAVGACLNDDAAINPEMGMQGEQLFLGCIVRRIGPVGGVGKLAPWAKHMAMGIAGAGRQDESRLAT
jgi:hypothetical protein